MRRLLPIIFILLFFDCILYAQNQKQYNHFIANQGLLNPAYNGTRDLISGVLVLRNQWVGLEGAPTTQALNVHTPLNYSPLGFGISVINETEGAHQTLDFYGAGSYRINFGADRNLSLGLQLGFNSFAFDQSKIETTNNTDEALYGSSNFSMNTGIGAYYYTNKYFIGFSVPEFFTNIYNTTEGTYKTTFSLSNIHYYLYGGYVFELNDEIALKPSILSRAIYGAPFQNDFTGSVLLYKAVWLGVTYKSSKEFVFLAEYIINDNFTVRYSFDYPFTDLNTVKNYGSHEVGLQYDFSLGKTVMRSIRYF